MENFIMNLKLVRYAVAFVVLGTVATQLPAMDGVALADGECFAAGCKNFRLVPFNTCTNVIAANSIPVPVGVVQRWMFCTNPQSNVVPIIKFSGPLKFSKNDRASKLTFKCTRVGLATIAARASSNRNCFVSVTVNCTNN